MSFLTKAELNGARKLRVNYQKIVSVTGGSFQGRSNPFANNGFPATGTYAGSNTANGVVPTDAITGFPVLPSFGGLEGYISAIELHMACTSWRSGWLFDLLFKAGAYSFGADVTLTAQPSFAARVPGADYKGLEIWVESATTFAGTAVVTVDYEDENGTPRVATATLLATQDLNRATRMSMASAGVSKITRVREAGATGGTFNVVVLRRLLNLLIGTQLTSSASVGYIGNPFSYLTTGLPRVYEDSALYVIGDGFGGSRTWGFSLEIALG
jgi:hypothetical protein